MAILTINHAVDQANTLIEQISSQDNTYYIYAAKSDSWSPDDNTVPTATDTVADQQLEVYNELLVGKRVTASDVSHMIARNTWANGTIYDHYDQANSSLFESDFYCVTSDMSVYKCIYNANGAMSTVEPTLKTTSGTFETADGYIWKYMFTIDAAANTKFTTANMVPVTTNTAVQGNAVGGTIDAIIVTAGGNSYNVYETGYVQAVVDQYTLRLPNTSSSNDNHYVNSSIYLKTGFGGGQLREISQSNGTAKTVRVALDEPFETFARLQISSQTTPITAGMEAAQYVDLVTYLYPKGTLNSDSNVVQSDTGAQGKVWLANSSILQIVRSTNTLFEAVPLPIRDLADNGTQKSGVASISSAQTISRGVVTDAGTGYTINNTAITITANGTGSGATANCFANGSGKIANIQVSAAGTLYAREPTITLPMPANTTFNANTAVAGGTGTGANNIITISSAARFVANDAVNYWVAAGNTAIGGLTANSQYYIQFANTTVVALSSTRGGDRVQLTPSSVSETGHALQGTRATGRLMPAAYLVTNGAGAGFTSNYASGDYIRVGQDANTNIRRIHSVNSTIIIVTHPFYNTLSGANTFKLNIAAQPTQLSYANCTGTVSNVALTAIQLQVSNLTSSDVSFTVGELVDMVDSANTTQGANGTVAFANQTTVFLTQTSGTWLDTLSIRGRSSLVRGDVDLVESGPTIMVESPTTSYRVGLPVAFLTDGTQTGTALVNNSVTLPDDTTEYVISPTVKLTGDGSNAQAYAIVNVATGSANQVVEVCMISTGSGYRNCDVEIYANTAYGAGATARALIAPITGHGADPVHELGARNVAIAASFLSANDESHYYPSSFDFRKVGILKNPMFASAEITVGSFDRASFTLADCAGTWQAGEVVFQSTSNATGVVVAGNSSTLEVKQVQGTFNSANALYGYTSATTANVSTANTIHFSVGAIEQIDTGATAYITEVVSNTVLRVANVSGQFANALQISGVGNAYANVSAISQYGGLRDGTANFTNRFNQTSRLVLADKTGEFVVGEQVEQAQTAITALVVNVTDLDVQTTGNTGVFAIGQVIENTNTGATATILFANSTYMRLTNCTNTAAYFADDVLENTLAVTCNVVATFPVLVVANLYPQTTTLSVVANDTIIGAQSGATGYFSNVSLSQFADLTRNTGTVLYSENLEPVEKGLNTREDVRLIIKY